jgi:hypothetical protein
VAGPSDASPEASTAKARRPRRHLVLLAGDSRPGGGAPREAGDDVVKLFMLLSPSVEQGYASVGT